MRFGIIIALAVVTAPALASETSTQEASPAAKPKKICKSEQLTTSRMPLRVCKTAAEWEQKGNSEAEKLKQLTPSSNPR